MRKNIIGILFFLLVFNYSICAISQEIDEQADDTKDDKVMVIEAGRKVSFDYKLTVDGEVADSSESVGPLEYVQGQGNIIPGLAKALEGLKPGDEKQVTVPPKEAYGEVNPEAFKEIQRSELPQITEPKTGMLLGMRGPDGREYPVKISEVKENSIVLDLNHPLAGKTLNFDVKIISVQ